MRLFTNPHRLFFSLSFTVALLLMWQLSHAGPIRDRIIEARRTQRTADIADGEPSGLVSLPAGVRLVRDVPYGRDARQRMDVYGQVNFLACALYLAPLAVF